MTFSSLVMLCLSPTDENWGPKQNTTLFSDLISFWLRFWRPVNQPGFFSHREASSATWRPLFIPKAQIKHWQENCLTFCHLSFGLQRWVFTVWKKHNKLQCWSCFSEWIWLNTGFFSNINLSSLNSESVWERLPWKDLLCRASHMSRQILVCSVHGLLLFLSLQEKEVSSLPWVLPMHWSRLTEME